MVDLLEKEILMRAAAGGKRTASDSAGGQVKKPRMDVYRPSWIKGSSLTAKRNDVGAFRGRGVGRGGGGGSGPGFRGGRGFHPGSHGGRRKFFPPSGYY